MSPESSQMGLMFLEMLRAWYRGDVTLVGCRRVGGICSFFQGQKITLDSMAAQFHDIPSPLQLQSETISLEFGRKSKRERKKNSEGTTTDSAMPC